MSLKLSNIRILNYKSINDTSIAINKIDGSYTTILVGLNETGKSNFLNGIGLINPPTENVSFEKYKNFSNEETQYVEAYYIFEYDTKQEWIELLQKKIKIPKKILDKITIKDISLNVYLQKGKTEFSKPFTLEYDVSDIDYASYSYIKLPKTQPEGTESYEYLICLSSDIDKYTTEQESPSNETFKTLSEGALEEILDAIFKDEFGKCILHFSKWEAKPEYLITKTIDLNEFKTNPKICYPLKNIFALANYKTQLEIANKIEEVTGNKSNIRKLENQLQKALTNYVKKVWEECSVEFDIKIQDTMQLDVFIIDDADKDNFFGMNDRSDGAKQFLSLILSISVANETEVLKNNIIVIDEPEVHMHPSGIRYIRDELLKIGQNNYVFVATHSQFMIDNKNKDRHYIVTKPNNNTVINPWDETRDLADDEILRLAFGINVLTDFLSPFKILVEGYSDCQIIKKTIDVLKPDNCINITNGSGSKIVSTAAMLKYYNVPVFTIVDADNDGSGYKKDIVNLGEPYTEDNVKTIKELSDSIVSKGTIEDTLKTEYVVKHFQKAFKKLTGIDEWDFTYTGQKPILEELKVYVKQKDKTVDIKKLTENAKTSIGEEFKPNKTSISRDCPKLKEICEKILQYFGLEVE